MTVAEANNDVTTEAAAPEAPAVGFVLVSPSVYGLMIEGHEVCQLVVAQVEAVEPVLRVIGLARLVKLARQANELADTVENCFAPNAGHFADDLTKFRDAQSAWDAVVGE